MNKCQALSIQDNNYHKYKTSKMGNLKLQQLNPTKNKQKQMVQCWNLMNKVFVSQVATLAIGGLLLGYYLTYTFCIVKNQLQEDLPMSPLCEECKVNNFEILCRGCKKIISCDDCFNKKKNKACKNCGVDLSKEDIVKVFMN